MKLTEELVNQVKSILSANMAAKIAALNTEYGDSLLEVPKTYSIVEKGLENIQEFPAVFVLADSHVWQDESRNQESGLAHHKILILIGVMEQNEDNLMKKLMRLLRATIEILTANTTLSGTALEVDFDRAEYLPMLRSREDVFLKDVFLEITVWTEEV